MSRKMKDHLVQEQIDFINKKIQLELIISKYYIHSLQSIISIILDAMLRWKASRKEEEREELRI